MRAIRKNVSGQFWKSIGSRQNRIIIEVRVGCGCRQGNARREWTSDGQVTGKKRQVEGLQLIATDLPGSSQGCAILIQSQHKASV